MGVPLREMISQAQVFWKRGSWERVYVCVHVCACMCTRGHV